MSRLLYVGRVSISVGLAAVSIYVTIGILLGGLAGYYGGWVDSLIMHLPELHDRVAERIATLTRNEAACVTCGAAHGVMLTAAACVVRDQLDHVTELPDVSSFTRTEIITWKSQSNGFLSGVVETGATLVEIGPDPVDLEAAINERTAGILWFAGTVFVDGALPLEEVIR